jgi:hypothetical protein
LADNSHSMFKLSSSFKALMYYQSLAWDLDISISMVIVPIREICVSRVSTMGKQIFSPVNQKCTLV